MPPDLLTYYAAPGPMTDPGKWASLFDALPEEDDLAAGVMDHIAALTLGGDRVFEAVRATYDADAHFHVPAGYMPAAYR